MPSPDRADRLADAPLEIVGRLTTASNATFLCRLGPEDPAAPGGAAAPAGSGNRAYCVYKPVLGERPLWDFPDGTLAEREYASYLISEALGWGIVPRTLLRDGPHGSGMVQDWIGPPPGAEAAGTGGPADDLIDIFPLDAVPDGFLPVLHAEDGAGRRVVLAHADDPRLERMAVLDAVLNNPDRKAGHVLRGPGDRLYGVDHGICLHAEHKLRTILWGWAGRELPAAARGDIARTADALAAGCGPAAQLDELLTVAETQALLTRMRRLIDTGVHPGPSGGHDIPWPPF